MSAASHSGAGPRLRTTSVARPFAWALVAVLAMATLASVAAWRFAVDEGFDSLRESRFRFGLGAVRATLESGLRLGFAPEDLPGAQVLIEQTQARQPDILAIEVFDKQGNILFSTDLGGFGATVPTVWRDRCLERTDAPVLADDEDGRVQCTALVNAFEQVTGGVMLRYRPRGGDPAGRTGRKVWLPLILALAALAAVGATIGWLMARPHERRLRKVVAALAGAAGGGASDRAGTDGSLAGPVPAGLDALERMERELDRLDAEADAIDRLEAH
jgi:hypothetical protein